MHVDVTVKGEVGHRLLQVESNGDQSVKAQPGFSGSPVWDHATGEAAGLLQVAPLADEPERDAYLLAPPVIAQAWERTVRLPASTRESLSRAGVLHRQRHQPVFRAG